MSNTTHLPDECPIRNDCPHFVAHCYKESRGIVYGMPAIEEFEDWIPQIECESCPFTHPAVIESQTGCYYEACEIVEEENTNEKE